MGDFEEINWTEEKEYEVQALRLSRGRLSAGGVGPVCFSAYNSCLV